ncbi:maleylpyruvate isomerase N-terminal domain-containing protein [uncultured Kocuria sp.]|uniref:maleylpyruvate isomerase N-terminal domain-containing protein n=1 Tax=uncultured Kocuria sp. TaxID=259305 RepID=UPI0034296EBB
MSDDDVWAAIDLQRRRTADLLAGLSEAQWDHPSLCQGWTVRGGADQTMRSRRAKAAAPPSAASTARPASSARPGQSKPVASGSAPMYQWKGEILSIQGASAMGER